MILHLRFRDGSNPWITYGDAAHCAEAWKAWRKNADAIPLFMCGDLRCGPMAGGGWVVGWPVGDQYAIQRFQHLARALRHMEREEAAQIENN